MANTSQSSGELKFTQSDPNVFGNGNTQYAIQILPMCIPGKSAAIITAKIVIASADLLMAILHF